jgi:hypothetical protein
MIDAYVPGWDSIRIMQELLSAQTKTPLQERGSCTVDLVIAY